MERSVWSIVPDAAAYAAALLAPRFGGCFLGLGPVTFRSAQASRCWARIASLVGPQRVVQPIEF
jgi:hypothetical protein